ncbi:hypothetical protein BV25DRAFT_1916346 [Artomyces pyxidatus]|uniref:Uncharacterized protein n=1 Tax=Artomyces pyxidatus TaxID=48021 RepID=A0ACB8T1I5_9AGAM|nr:hypothetical protein BV25DRAFT_1916346 [Artomyces pyxidatus]
MLSISSHSHNSLDLITFEGKPDEDVSIFLRDVKQVALRQGDLDNDDWIKHYVESCLSGTALGCLYAGLRPNLPHPMHPLRCNLHPPQYHRSQLKTSPAPVHLQYRPSPNRQWSRNPNPRSSRQSLSLSPSPRPRPAHRIPPLSTP